MAKQIRLRDRIETIEYCDSCPCASFLNGVGCTFLNKNVKGNAIDPDCPLEDEE